MGAIAMMRHGTCLGTWRHFNEYYDSELDDRRQRRVRDHLLGCRRCRRAYDRFVATIADLSLLADPSSLSDESLLADLSLLADSSSLSEGEAPQPGPEAPSERANVRAAVARRITGGTDHGP